MNIANREQTLVALLLALSDLPADTAATTTQPLLNIAQQLAANPDAWEAFIAPNLTRAIAQSPDLQNSFVRYQSKLTQAGLESAIGLQTELPNAVEVATAIPVGSGCRERGFRPGRPEQETASAEINNIAVRILSSPEPALNTQKLGAFERLKAKLNQSIG